MYVFGPQLLGNLGVMFLLRAAPGGVEEVDSLEQWPGVATFLHRQSQIPV